MSFRFVLNSRRGFITFIFARFGDQNIKSVRLECLRKRKITLASFYNNSVSASFDKVLRLVSIWSTICPVNVLNELHQRGSSVVEHSLGPRFDSRSSKTKCFKSVVVAPLSNAGHMKVIRCQNNVIGRHNIRLPAV